MKRMKILICSFIAAVACLASGVGMAISSVTGAASAKAAAEVKSVEQVSLVMKNGASVRYASSATDSGIRFSVNLSAADYLGLEANEGNVYTSVSYGMAIMPYSYLGTYGELTEENLFSDDAKYDWAQWNGSEWVYSGDNTTKKRIICLSYGEMVVDNDNAGYYVFSGSMSGIYNSNLARDFVGRGYIKAIKTDGTVEYVMADYTENSVHNNVRSIVEVAEKAVADENVTDQDKLDSLVDYYLDATNVRQVKFYDGDELIGTCESKKNYAFNDTVQLGDGFSHWEDENGNIITADSSYEITGTTKLYAVYNGSKETVAVAQTAIDSFLAMAISSNNVVAAQAQYETVRTAIEALRANDYNKYITEEVCEQINAKVNEINTFVENSDDLYEEFSGVLHAEQSYTVSSNDGDQLLSLPQVDYSVFKKLTFTWASSGWTFIGPDSANRWYNGGDALGGDATITYVDGKLQIAMTLTTGGTGSFTIENTDADVINGRKGLTLSYNCLVGSQTITIGEIVGFSVYDVWAVEANATLYTGQTLIDNVSVTDASGGVPFSESASSKIDGGVNYDCSGGAITNWTVYLPKINYLAYQTVSLTFQATSNWQTFGFVSGGRISDSGGSKLTGTITFTNNGDGTVTCVISEAVKGNISYTITDSNVLNGTTAFTLFWNQGAVYRQMSFGPISATLGLDGRMEIAIENGKTPKLVSDVIYSGQTLIDNVTVTNASGGVPFSESASGLIDGGVNYDCSGTSATDWTIYLPKINYLAYQTVSLTFQATSNWQTFGFVSGGRIADSGGSALTGTITFTNNGDGTVTCVISEAVKGNISYTITDSNVLNGTTAFTLFWNQGAVYRQMSFGPISATYQVSAEKIDGISYEKKEIAIDNIPHFAVTEKVVAESVSVSCADSTTATPLNLPLINYSLYERVTMDWSVSGWTQTGQGGDLWFYNYGDALGGTVTIVNNGDGTLTFTMIETVAGQGTHTKTISDSAIVNGKTALTLNGKSLVGAQTLVATNIKAYNGKEPVSSSPVEYVLKDFSLSTYETTVYDTDAPERGELLVALASDGERISLEAQNVVNSDGTENIYTVTLPWIDYSALNYVKTTISTNNGKAIGFATNDMLLLVQYHDTTNDTWPMYDTDLTLTYENGVLAATLWHQGYTKTITVTDEDVINGNKGFSFYVKGVAYTGYQMTDLVANGKSNYVVKNEKQTLDLSEQSGNTEYSEYRIAWNAHDAWTNDYYNYEFAAEELASFLNRWTGKKYQLVKMYGGEAIQPDSKYIVLGGQLAEEAGMTLDGLEKSNGYKVVQDYTNLYIYSETSEGTLAGLYGFLKEQADVTFYTDEVFTENVTENSATVEAGMDIIFNPSFNGAQAGYAEMQYSEAYQRRLGMYADWNTAKGAALKGAATEWDATLTTGGHNMLEVFPYETYGSTYSDWYTTVSGTRQLNFTSSNTHLQEMKDMFVESAKVVIANCPQIEYFEFGQPDSQYGPDVAGYLSFMNDVAATLDAWLAVENHDRTIALVMYAYNSTRTAPASGEIYNGDNVYVTVYFAPVGMRYTEKVDGSSTYHKNTTENEWDGSITVYESLASWTKLEGFNKDRNLIYWMYGTDFYNYMMPMDTLTNLQYNYQKLHETGTDMIKYQFQTGSKDSVGSDWQRLKTYLSSELAKDVNADVTSLQANFMDAMYGAGATYMQQLLSAQQAHCTYDNFNSLDSALYSNYTEQYFGIINGSVKLMTSRYFSQNTLTAWMGYIDNAKAAVNADASLTNDEKAAYIEHIEVEALSIRYMLIKLHGVTTYDASTSAWETHAASLGCVTTSES